MHLLEVPAVLSRVRVDGNDRDAEQVVAGANSAVKIGTGIAGREIDEVELGIDGRRLPDGRAAELPRGAVRGPRVMTELAGARNRVERPDELAVARAERPDLAAARHLAAREAGDDQAVVVERRARDAEAVLPTLGLDGPNDLARALIERDEPRVVQAHEDLTLAH